MSDEQELSRRDALKLIGAAPLAGFITIGSPAVGRAIEKVAALPEQETGEQFVPKFFTAHEYRTVRVLVDDIIPRDEQSGSATDAKVPEFMDYILADTVNTPDGRRYAIRGGLAWLDHEAEARFATRYATLSTAQRHQILDDIAWPKKAKPELEAGAAFFSSFRDFTASGFYSTAIGWKDVRYEGNVFNPNWNGCPPEALKKLGVSYDAKSE